MYDVNMRYVTSSNSPGSPPCLSSRPPPQPRDQFARTACGPWPARWDIAIRCQEAKVGMWRLLSHIGIYTYVYIIVFTSSPLGSLMNHSLSRLLRLVVRLWCLWWASAVVLVAQTTRVAYGSIELSDQAFMVHGRFMGLRPHESSLYTVAIFGSHYFWVEQKLPGSLSSTANGSGSKCSPTVRRSKNRASRASPNNQCRSIWDDFGASFVRKPLLDAQRTMLVTRKLLPFCPYLMTGPAQFIT